MRNFRHLLSAVMLILALAISTSAGQIEIPRTNPSPVQASTTTEGQIDLAVDDGQISTTAPSSDSVIEAALNLVRGVLSLF